MTREQQADSIIDAIRRSYSPTPGALTITVDLPSWVQWIVQEDDGDLVACEERPRITPGGTIVWEGSSNMDIGYADNPTDKVRIWHITDDGWRHFTLTIAEAP